MTNNEGKPFLKGELLGSQHMTDQDEEKLQRSLTNRHIQMIAIGGAIGTGLFMGSGKTLSVSGTSIILTYIIIGFFFFFVMRAMGELLLSNTNYKTFADFATVYLGPWAGFFIGWSYWLNWIITAIVDVIVIGGYTQFWYPDIPVWIPAFGSLVILTLLNFVAVRIFGEMEFWFALIKIIAIVLFLCVGLYLILISFVSPSGVQASLSHAIEKGSMFPYGVMGFLAGFQIAVFAFVGIELVGTTAAETKDPHKSLPRAINSIPVRILLFYIGALLCIIAVTSWSQVSPDKSPFVEMFTLVGLPVAAGVVNFVVATSALSSANSGIFATSRMLYGLSVDKDAPKSFSKLSKSKVPLNSLFFSMFCVVIGTSILFIVPDVMTAFTIVSALTSILCIFTFALIILSYIAYRKQAPEVHAVSAYKMPGGVPMAWITFAFLLFTVVILALDHDTLIALLVSPIWFGGLFIAYRYKRRKILIHTALVQNQIEAKKIS
ncbi:amino acid permease [Acinetobacter variabilis]|jgi:D-serine/D-alanine/glycine transporter|uniref:Amino acid permease n=1 Tax=Acinetobacter lwoffii TaxID=28090 RepID=A0AAJ4P460_ACILW|nr:MULTISPECIES: amino acid permease [Pseudomonadota]ODN53904.1 amino acid transporter [Acinetobacter sp. 51m]AUC06557.1 amino acid permease [Acinetobacter lwoffii]MCU4313005.1 amino acid permease [Acinetobacter variabilis]MCU4451061.1 amino acid permease [Acinetobacter lwoffii]MCU4615483.1 amino acid permease [Acinetobacter lwoffii]